MRNFIQKKWIRLMSSSNIMKINWGTGIVIAFIAFISFIMYFVINMNINKKYDHDLVTEDYYKKELEFQNDIDKETNAKNLVENLRLQMIKPIVLVKLLTCSIWEPLQMKNFY